MAPRDRVEVRCAFCHTLHGAFEKKYVPKSFVCARCKTGQSAKKEQTAGHAYSRNYPEGYFDS